MKLEGVFTPIVTPFDDDNCLNGAAVDAIVDTQVEAGVAGLIAGGTTGEYYALDDAEREQLTERVVARAAGRVPVIAGINALNTADGVRRAERARALGCDGLMMSPPAYSLPGQDEILAHFRAVAGATDLPLILYDFPDRAGVQIEPETVRALAAQPTVVGIKESSGDFSRFLALNADVSDGFAVICGCDDHAADHLWWGVRAWISGSANVFPRAQAAMVAAAGQGDFDQVRRLMAAMLPAIRHMEGGGYNQKAKLGASIRTGVETGPVRQPLLPLDASESEEFQHLVRNFEYEAS